MNSDALKGFVKAFIILGVILTGWFFFRYYTWHGKDLDDFDLTYHEDDDIKEEKVLDDKEYKDLYNKMSFEYMENNFGKEFFDMYYGNKEFTDEYYIYVGLLSLLGNELTVNCNIDKAISSFEVEMEVRNIFGDINFTNNSFKVNNGTFSATYNDIDNMYRVVTNKCSGFDFSNGGIKTEYYKSALAGDFLYIYEKVAYLDYSTDESGGLVFNYHGGVSKEDNIIANNYDEEMAKKLPTYRLIFEKSGESYKFVSIVKEY